MMTFRLFVLAVSLVAAISSGLVGPLTRPAQADAKSGVPQVVVISLDGARADVVDAFLRSRIWPMVQCARRIRTWTKTSTKRAGGHV
jgi:hypothetical protein